MRAFVIALLLAFLAGCSDSSLPPPRPEAERRADERERIAADFARIAEFYKAYATKDKEPNSDGFWKYLTEQEAARAICQAAKEGRYNVQIPRGANGMIGYERDVDFNNTRVIVRADGTVNKVLPEVEFQELLLDGKR